MEVKGSCLWAAISFHNFWRKPRWQTPNSQSGWALFQHGCQLRRSCLPLVHRSFRLPALLPAESLTALKHTAEDSQMHWILSLIHIRCCSRTWSFLKRPWIHFSFLAFSWSTLPLSWLTLCTKLGLVGIVAPEVVSSLTKHRPIRRSRGHAVYFNSLASCFRLALRNKEFIPGGRPSTVSTAAAPAVRGTGAAGAYPSGNIKSKLKQYTSQQTAFWFPPYTQPSLCKECKS